MDGPSSPEQPNLQPEIGQDVIVYKGGRMIITPIEGTARILGSDWLGAEAKENGKVEETAIKNLTQEGVRIAIEQRAHGWTGISAQPLEGFKLAFLKYNPNSDEEPPVWTDIVDPEYMTTIVFDRGNMHKLDPNRHDYTSEAYGNPGYRHGFIRVTDPTGQVRDYAVGANFQGRTDNWMIKSYIGGVNIEDIKDAPLPQET